MSSLAQGMLKTTTLLSLIPSSRSLRITAMIDFMLIEIKDILYYQVVIKLFIKYTSLYISYLTVSKRLGMNRRTFFSPSRQSQGDTESKRTCVVS